MTSDFVLVPPFDYVAELLRLVPDFESSREYRSLDTEDRTVAGLAFSAFAKFMESSSDQSIIDECRNAIECFASMNDPEAENLLITEVFEAFRHPENSFNLLLPVSRALYNRWIVS